MFLKSPLQLTAGLLIAAFSVFAMPNTGHAALDAYEPFDYSSSIPDGTPTTASGFSGNWTIGSAPSIVGGLTYLDLPTTNNALSSSSGRQFQSFSTSISNGTKWISFLFNMSGNNGANACGVYFPNGGTGLFFGYGTLAVTGTEGRLGLASTTTTGTSPESIYNLANSFLGTYGTTPYLVAMEIEFNTSGIFDTVTVYLNPTADSAAPGVTPTYSYTSFDVGTISGIGFQNSGGGKSILVDEIRVGDSYADVVSDSSGPTPPPPAITGISPMSGLTNGGTVVTLTGSNFLAGATVNFGSNPGTGVILTGSTNLTATTPAGTPGAVNVVVANTNGLPGTVFGGFTYELPPLPPAVLVPGSVMVSGSNLTFRWMGTTNTTSVLLSTTDLTSVSPWTPITTNLFGSTGLSTNIIPIDPGEPERFYSLTLPTEIIVVLAPTSLHTIPSGSTNAIALAWTASTTAETTGYRIDYGLDSGALTNSVVLGDVTSAVIFGLTPGLTYHLAVVTLTDSGESLAEEALISAQTDTEISIIDLFDISTVLEPPTTVDTTNALYTYVADRVRDRHAREDQFQLYDHYLSWYWEQRIATIEIIDTVGKGTGTDSVTFNYTTQARLNPAEFRAFFLGQTTEAQYYYNAIATLVTNYPSKIVSGEIDYNYTVTLSSNPTKPPGQQEFAVGDRMEIEISQFLQAPRNGRNNYYGTAFLYIVGQGIVPWEGIGPVLDSFPLPLEGWLGGQTTLPYQYSDEPEHHFKQTAGNIAPTNGYPFMFGRRLHHTDFGDGTHSEAGNPIFTAHVGKLGPKFIARSCVDCHVNNGRALPPAIGAPMLQTVMRVGSDASGSPHPTLGSVLQPKNTSGPAEGSATISSYTITPGTYGDGSPYTLQTPNYTFSGTTPAFYSARLALPLVGLGLLEAVSEGTIMALADPADADVDGISGRVQTVIDPETGQGRIGRFSTKAGKARVSHQVAAALNTDMGVRTSIFPIYDGETNSGPVEITTTELDEMTRYIALLGVSARRDLADAQALQGELLFDSLGCIKCHTPTLTTSAYAPLTELRNQTIHPFTDLLLHDMGSGLADNMGEGVAAGSEWRTPPLWSIGLTAGVSGGEAYLHDGRARTLDEAILWHGGEGEVSKEAFRNETAANRAALIKFLQSL
jgi:CxxC motif-containing protein (DUF1111 family)